MELDVKVENSELSKITDDQGRNNTSAISNTYEDGANIKVEQFAKNGQSSNNNLCHIRTKPFEKYHLNSQHMTRNMYQQLVDLSPDDRSNLTVLHFDKFDVLMNKDDSRIPIDDNTAELEVCKKFLFEGTKVLHFLRIKFPTKGVKMAAQILPPGRERAGVTMARLGGVAVITGWQRQLRMGRSRNNRRIFQKKGNGWSTRSSLQDHQ